MQIIWSAESRIDLQVIHEYICRDSETSADFIVESIILFADSQLTLFPNSGRTGRLTNTFELVVPKFPYFIPYRLHNNRIEILRVYHTSRLLPSSF